MPEDLERTSYEDMVELIFGMDPGDWAAILHQKLLESSRRLGAARAFLEDASRDTSDAIEAAALAEVRLGSALVLANIYQMLFAMPLLQSVPGTLDGLHYVLTSVSDVERGAAPAWLVAKSTKAHPTKAAAQVGWMEIVTCVQLLRLLPAFKSEDAASKEVQSLTGRSSSAIKHWCRKLHSPSQCQILEARAQIELELLSMRTVLKLASPDSHNAIVRRRISELLAPSRS